MIVSDIICLLLVASILSLILTHRFSWRHPACPARWPAALFVFLVTFFCAWAAGVWIEPVGGAPALKRWLAFTLTALAVCLLLLVAAGPPRRPLARDEAIGQAREAANAKQVFGPLLWGFLAALLASAALRYLG